MHVVFREQRIAKKNPPTWREMAASSQSASEQEPVLVDWSEMAREMKKTHLVAWLQGHQLILKIFTWTSCKILGRQHHDSSR